VKELMQTLYVVANNAYLNVDFDTSVIKSYRLIGYDNPIVNDVNTEKVLEGGEIGTGHTVTAIFEIETTEHEITSDMFLGKVELNYQLSDTAEIIKKHFVCLNNYQPFEKIDSSYLFLTSVAEFGMLLRNSKHVKNTTWDALQAQVNKSARRSDFWQDEFIQIVKQASYIYDVGKKKKKLRGSKHKSNQL
jgi:Ca-activated chloride channel family protein